MKAFVPRSYSLAELVALARQESPYHREAYAQLPTQPTLQDLPVVDPTVYWQAHTADRRNVLTGPLMEGTVFSSGGSTGAPKFVYYTSEEWDSLTTMSARSFHASGLRDGDRVANLFAAGSLYGSFMHASSAFERCRREIVHLPIGYFCALPDAAQFIRTFDVQVLAGMPTHLASVVDLLSREGLDGLDLRLLLFAGETFTADQRAHLQTRVPGLEIRSGGYASADAGNVGFADLTCQPGEHRTYDGATILEILDESTGEPITSAGEPGRIVVTNLTRRLMPMLRYPSGDRGEWLEPIGTPERRFMLLGRAEEQVRVAAVNLSVAEMRTILEPIWERLGVTQFQLLVTHESFRDLLTMRLVSAAPPGVRAAIGDEMIDVLQNEIPLLGKLVAAETVHRIRIAWIEPGDLIVNARTGKTLTIVDRRNEASNAR